MLFEDHTGKNTKYLEGLGYKVKPHRFLFSHNDFIAIPASRNESAFV